MRLITLCLAVALASCADAARDSPLVIDGIAYSVPVTHAQSRAGTPPLQFIRIRPPDRPFELIHDHRTAKKVATNGWPVIFSLNDGTAPTVEHAESDGLKIVCVRAPAPAGGCGFRLSDRGAEWTVLFPQMHLASAGRIRDEAAAQLQAYREDLS